MALTPGTKLGPYEIVAPIGASGMGEVYRARDKRLDRTVAIKVLNSSVVASPELRQRFEREARTISRLNHPHICTLHDVGHHDGTDFLVMEYLEGETLAQRLSKGALAPPPSTSPFDDSAGTETREFAMMNGPVSTKKFKHVRGGYFLYEIYDSSNPSSPVLCKHDIPSPNSADPYDPGVVVKP